MDIVESEKSSNIPEGITHRYLRVNLIRHELLRMEPRDIQELQEKLEGIDKCINRPNFVDQFLEDIQDHGSFEKTLANSSQIQGLGYECGKYGFFDQDGDPTLTNTQKMRLEYAGIIIREALLKRSDLALGIRDVAQKHQAHINWLLELPTGLL